MGHAGELTGEHIIRVAVKVGIEDSFSLRRLPITGLATILSFFSLRRRYRAVTPSVISRHHPIKLPLNSQILGFSWCVSSDGGGGGCKNSRAEKILWEEPQKKSFRVSCRTETGKGKWQITFDFGQSVFVCVTAALYIFLLNTLVIIFTKERNSAGNAPFIFLSATAPWVLSFPHPWRSVLNDP